MHNTHTRTHTHIHTQVFHDVLCRDWKANVAVLEVVLNVSDFRSAQARSLGLMPEGGAGAGAGTGTGTGAGGAKSSFGASGDFSTQAALPNPAHKVKNILS